MPYIFVAHLGGKKYFFFFKLLEMIFSKGFSFFFFAPSVNFDFSSVLVSVAWNSGKQSIPVLNPVGEMLSLAVW